MYFTMVWRLRNRIFCLEAVKPSILLGFVAFWARKSLPGGLREASGGALGPLLAAFGRSWRLLAGLERLLERYWRLLGDLAEKLDFVDSSSEFLFYRGYCWCWKPPGGRGWLLGWPKWV